jgi:hypothetical protein
MTVAACSFPGRQRLHPSSKSMAPQKVVVPRLCHVRRMEGP